MPPAIGNMSIFKNLGKIVFSFVFLFVILVLFFGSWYTVNAGYVGVKTRFGAVVGTSGSGIHFKIPLIDNVTRITTKTRTIDYDKGGDNGQDKNTDSNLFSASKDLQDVAIGIVVNYHINPNNIVTIFTDYRDEATYEANVIEPVIREVVKSAAAQFTADELVTKRIAFSEMVNKNLAERMEQKYAVLERSSVTNFSFSDSFSKAIEAKVTAVQNAEASKNKLEQVKFEAQQQIESAKAQAEAIRIQAQAINSQGGADYVQLKAVEKWNGVLPAQMVPNAAVPFLNLK